MTKYFSAATCSFYDTDVFPENNLPEDCVIVEEETYKSLMEQQNAGFVIVPDSDGNPSVMSQSCGACHCTVHEKTVATKDQLGHVKLDGETLDLNEDGELTVIGGAGGGLEIGDVGFAPLGIDETQNKRRYLNGQVISQSQFEAFTNKVKSAIALYPNLSATEENWQAEVTNSKLGQCGKFVVDNIAGTIRLPKVVNINGLTDLALLGGLKAESLPNIKGDFDKKFVIYEDTGKVNGTGLFSSTVTTANDYHGWSQHSGINADIKANASDSSSAYQDGAPVQQEAVQYPYFIQVATGTEETLPAISEYKVNTPFFFGMSQWFESDPKNASWLISNGNFHKGATYTDMYKQLQVELNDSLNVGDTVEIDGRTFVKRGLPVKLSTDEYDEYDFVINTADTTFRLPLKTKLASGSAVVGNGMTLGLTNGTQNLGLSYSGNTQYGLWGATGSYGTTVGQTPSGDSTASKTVGITTDPEKSGIETSSNGLKLYFYVGDTLQDPALINAGGVLDYFSKLNTVHCVVETFKSGSSWYRVYDDGWVEQGGYHNADAVAVSSVSLLKSYKDTNYSILITNLYNASAAKNAPHITTVATTGFSYWSENTNGDIYWETKGYGA